MLNKRKFLKKNTLINAWIHSKSISSAMVLLSFDFDSITIDLQHGMLDIESCINLLQLINLKRKFSIVRVPTNDIGIINKCLDAGAGGIICPLINNKEECKSFLKNCHYPPDGNRSFGPTIASINNEQYFKNRNKEIFSVVMIETKESVENLDQILSQEKLDAIYIGPYDLSISYGVDPSQVYKLSNMLKLYQNILKKARSYEKIVAIHCSGAETASFFANKGFDMVTLSTDLNLLKTGIKKEFNQLIKKI